MKKIFIDGKEGTTGLEIFKRIEGRTDVEFIVLPDEIRKDTEARRKAINESDVTILCLPDAAAKESVSLCENPDTVILDASTAHRTNPDWTYGLPELSPEQKEKIKHSKRIAVPGCHASGFIVLVSQLVKNGIISADTLLTCHSITGYSGGGKKMIAQYEDENRDVIFDAPRPYGLTQSHKHIPEMVHVTGLKNAPVFCPIVGDFYSGMLVSVPLFGAQLNEGYTINDVKACLKKAYNGSDNIEYVEDISENGFVDSNTLSGTDKMQVSVTGNEERMVLMARYDNLGKGASGATLQNLELVLSSDTTDN